MMSYKDILRHARECRANPETQGVFDEYIVDWRTRWERGTGRKITLTGKDLTKLRAKVMLRNRR